MSANSEGAKGAMEGEDALLDQLQAACDGMATLLKSRETGHGMWWMFAGERFRSLKAAISAIENQRGGGK